MRTATVYLLLCALFVTTISSEVDIRNYMKKSRHSRGVSPDTPVGIRKVHKSAMKTVEVTRTFNSNGDISEAKVRQKRGSSCGSNQYPPTLTTEQAYKQFDFNPSGIKKELLNVVNKETTSIIANIYKQSREDAEQMFPQAKQTYKDYKFRAFHQALWMYRVTKEFDDETAKAFGDAHERSIDNVLFERVLDLHNNEVGRCLAQETPAHTDSDIDVINEALTTGKLMTDIPFDEDEAFDFQVEFSLYTNNPGNIASAEVITNSNSNTLSQTNFSANRDTKFLVHGWRGSDSDSWIGSMKDELLKHDDYNVIAVDWKEGAASVFYFPSANNIDETGEQIFNFIQMLKTEVNYDESRIHLIGYSLGAQACGAAGRRIPTIGRITGLDPAYPLFHKKGNFRQLDKTDAQFVDIIHSDGNPSNRTVVGIFQMFQIFRGLGCFTPLGDVDFYPNGGKTQPGCSRRERKSKNEPRPEKGCDHNRAVQYFSESINVNCTYKSYPCDPEKTCSTCGTGGCNRMGFHATKSPGGTFYLETNAERTYCKD